MVSGPGLEDFFVGFWVVEITRWMLEVLRAQRSGFRVQGSGFRVQGSGFRVQGSGFKVQRPGIDSADEDAEGRLWERQTGFILFLGFMVLDSSLGITFWGFRVVKIIGWRVKIVRG